MLKERMMAILIGGLMLFSVAGFAMIGLGRFATNGDEPLQIPTAVDRVLTAEEVSIVLRNGRVLIRNVYTADCTTCAMDSATLELFVNIFKGYIILESVMAEPDNFTSVDKDGRIKFEMISPTGDIVDLNEIELNQEGLTDRFCDISVIQPRECLLRDVGRDAPVPLMPEQSPEQNETSQTSPENTAENTTNASSSS
jgi:hypothetical protein